MKEHLINKKKENKILSYTHRIILGVLITILLYDFAFKYNKEKFNFLSFEQINLFLNIIYYFLCVINEINKKETKKLYHKYFHLCFSLSGSIPIIFFIIYILNNSEDLKTDISILNICFLMAPIIFNILETLIIKRYKPSYISPALIIIILLCYNALIYFLGRMGMDIGYFISESLKEIDFIMQLFVFSIIGTFGGWWLYKFMTKPKIKKINLDSSDSADSNELSEE